VTDWDPEVYERWFKTPLGRVVDADEKAVFFGLADLKRGERVIDVGCGAGNYTIPAAERTGMAIGIDLSEPMLRAAQRRRQGQEGIAYVQGTGEMLPFPAASFDAVLIVTVLCFLSNLKFCSMKPTGCCGAGIESLSVNLGGTPHGRCFG
jgi:SAM-dependent methyltransferase